MLSEERWWHAHKTFSVEHNKTNEIVMQHVIITEFTIPGRHCKRFVENARVPLIPNKISLFFFFLFRCSFALILVKNVFQIMLNYLEWITNVKVMT